MNDTHVRVIEADGVDRVTIGIENLAGVRGRSNVIVAVFQHHHRSHRARRRFEQPQHCGILRRVVETLSNEKVNERRTGNRGRLTCLNDAQRNSVLPHHSFDTRHNLAVSRLMPEVDGAPRDDCPTRRIDRPGEIAAIQIADAQATLTV